LYLTVVVIIGLALGALLRKTAAGLAVFAAVFFVIPIVVGPSAEHHGVRALPAVQRRRGPVGQSAGTAHALSPWAGFAVLCGTRSC